MRFLRISTISGGNAAPIVTSCFLALSILYTVSPGIRAWKKWRNQQYSTRSQWQRLTNVTQKSLLCCSAEYLANIWNTELPVAAVLCVLYTIWIEFGAVCWRIQHFRSNSPVSFPSQSPNHWSHQLVELRAPSTRSRAPVQWYEAPNQKFLWFFSYNNVV